VDLLSGGREASGDSGSTTFFLFTNSHFYYCLCRAIFFAYWLRLYAAPLEEQERLLVSVIRKLDDSGYATSSANGHAYYMRAKYYLQSMDFENAKLDAQKSISIITACSQSTTVVSQAYRVWSDAEEGLGNIPGAVQALQEWANADPSWRTKANDEIQRLVASAASE
jgi:tetratricopeptide (TPR) repeat protein